MPGKRLTAGLCLASLLLTACAGANKNRPGYNRNAGGYHEPEPGPAPEPEQIHEEASGFTQVGVISFYANKFHGRKTASGEIFNKHAMTAAHRTLPFRTRVKVTNLENGKSVVVIINDRGPFARNRILDLSPAAAREIGLKHQGTVRAQVTVL